MFNKINSSFRAALSLIAIIIFISMSFNNSYASCIEGRPLLKTTYSPDEFQAQVILNSFLKDHIIDDMTKWFTDSHFPYGNNPPWHKINLETTTIDLSKNGIDEKLVMVYYDSQLYCGAGGQCSTYLLREVAGVWQKIQSWHDVKFQDLKFSCETKSLQLLVAENSPGGFDAETKRWIMINL